MVSDFVVLNDYTELNKLDKLYIDSRYPGDFGLLPDGKPGVDDARIFYEFAEELFDRVCKILNIDKTELFK